MKIIYCHHAERDVDPITRRSQSDGLTSNGLQDAELVAESLASEKITAIYTSNFYRCRMTAQIINRKFNVPVIEEDRFNEIGSIEGEDWKGCLQRNISALNNIMDKYNDEDTILCLTSGVNLSAFVCWNLKEKPHKDFPFIAPTNNCSPVFFYMFTKTKYREVKFLQPYLAYRYKKNKAYRTLDPTFGELKTNILLELRHQSDLMELFTNKLQREQYLTKSGDIERAQSMGEIEVKKYLANKLALDTIQVIKDYASINNLDINTIRTSTALNLNEEQCVKNMSTYTERLFYLDTNIQETLMLIYSTLVSYINYQELVLEDIEKTSILVERERGSYLDAKLVYKL